MDLKKKIRKTLEGIVQVPLTSSKKVLAITQLEARELHAEETKVYEIQMLIHNLMVLFGLENEEINQKRLVSIDGSFLTKWKIKRKINSLERKLKGMENSSNRVKEILNIVWSFLEREELEKLKREEKVIFTRLQRLDRMIGVLLVFVSKLRNMDLNDFVNIDVNRTYEYNSSVKNCNSALSVLASESEKIREDISGLRVLANRFNKDLKHDLR